MIASPSVWWSDFCSFEGWNAEWLLSREFLSNGARVLKQEAFLFLFCRCLLQLGPVCRESRCAGYRMFYIWPIWSKLLCVLESLDLFNLLGTWCLTTMFDLRQRLGMSCRNLAETLLLYFYVCWIVRVRLHYSVSLTCGYFTPFLSFAFFLLIIWSYLSLFSSNGRICCQLRAFLAILMLEP